MYELIIRDAEGQQLTFGDYSPYIITEIEGLSPPESDVLTSDLALIDGALYNNTKVRMRTLNIAFAIDYQAEKHRLEAYKVLRPKRPVTVFYKSDLRDVFIEGYVATCTVTHFEMKQVCTVQIVCPSPYFRAAQEVINELSSIIAGFHFSFFGLADPNIVFGIIENESTLTITNNGEADTGIIVTIYIRGSVDDVKIYNYVTQDFFGIQYSFQAGDEITIDTTPGKKTVTLLRNGVEINLYRYIMYGSKWLQLEGRQTTFVYEITSGSLGDVRISFKHYDLYGGV